jgi:peptide chain release factor subunit 1
MTLAAVQRQLDRLTSLPVGEHPIISCYLKLEPRDRAAGKYLIKLKNRIKAVLDTLPEQGYSKAELKVIARDLDRLHADLARPGSLPSTRGVAIFISSALKLHERVDVPMVYRSRLVVDRSPLIRQLLAAEDEVGRLLTVALDRTAARIFEVTAFGAREVSDLQAAATPGSRYHRDRQDAPGIGEMRWNSRIRSEKQRHLSAVAEELFALDRRQPVHGIVLAGMGTDATVVEPFLHPYLRDRVMGTVKLNPKQISPADVHRATLEVRAAYEEQVEDTQVTELVNNLGTGWAVQGVRETLRALGKGQVRALLVDSQFQVPGVRCASGRLALSDKDCRGEVPAVPVQDVIDEAVEEALRQRVQVEVLQSQSAAKRIDGLAGMLRFR